MKQSIDQFFQKIKPSTIKGVITIAVSGLVTAVSITIAVTTYFTSNIHKMDVASLKLQFDQERVQLTETLNAACEEKINEHKEQINEQSEELNKLKRQYGDLENQFNAFKTFIDYMSIDSSNKNYDKMKDIKDRGRNRNAKKTKDTGTYRWLRNE